MKRGIFERIPEERLKSVLSALHAYTQLPMQLIDAGGEVQLRFGRENGYCRLLKRHVFTGSECAELYVRAGQYAHRQGEAYVFTCHSNMNHIAFPLVNQGELLGCIIIGPFLMDAPDSTLVSSLMEKHTLSPGLALELYDELPGLQVVAPDRVEQLSRLVGHMLSALLPAERAQLMLSYERLNQQSRINETIQMYKARQPAPGLDIFYEKEAALLSRVKTGNLHEAKALLNDLLGLVLFNEGGRLENVRGYAVEFAALISRTALATGAPVEEVHSLKRRCVSMMNECASLDVLCQLLQDMLELIMDAMFGVADRSNAHIRQALAYISEHYTEPLTLALVAGHVKLSVNYFSSIFRQTMGMSFREYLTHLRVEESKRLLLTSDQSLTDIALAMGFADQSYYCKVFKRIVGMTPGKFRF